MDVSRLLAQVAANPDAITGALVIAGLSIAIVLFAMGVMSLGERDSAERRLRGAAQRNAASSPTPVRSLRAGGEEGAWERLLRPIEERLTFLNDADQGELRRRLLQAGYRHPRAVRIYYAVRVALAAVLSIPFLIVFPLVSTRLDPQTVPVVAAALAAFGLYLPYRVVQHRLEKRQQVIADGFPDALDMMVVCVEAGLGLDAAFSQVGKQMARSHPELAEEFAVLALGLRAGHTREQALRRLAERTGVDEVNSFVTLVIQSDRLGASVSQTLRVQAEDMRTKRMLRAEEKAHKLPVKMVVPLVTCILPAMLTAVLLPGIIGIVRNILPALG